jgi:indolepyruvate ferredoxin oxidoreductase
VRISAGGARLVLGCDLVVAAGFDTLAKMQAGASHAIVNSHQTVTGDFTRNPDLAFPGQEMQELIAAAVGPERAEFLDATNLATALLGNTIATNLFMVGYAWQRGLIPLSLEALERAIELNGVAVEANKEALVWGRRAAHDLAAVEALAKPREEPPSLHLSADLDEVVARRVDFLTGYQNAAYGSRYRALVERARAAETARTPGMSGLAESVARYYFKLLAYKDEYEVARLFAAPEFRAKLRAQFEGDYKLHFHLAPPLISRRDPDSGHLIKREFGPWILPAMKLLARLRGLRGTRFDPFGRAPERRRERQLIADYEILMDEVLAGLDADSHALAIGLASVPEGIRGYGHVKNRHLEVAEAHQKQLLQAFRNPETRQTAAE